MDSMTEPGSAEFRERLPHRHMDGDKHLARGFHYECALRCLWLLDLRGTENRLAVAEGDDAKIFGFGGTTYRQAKKREESQWAYSDSLRDFVERAYNRFAVDRLVCHEFYTNQAIPAGKTRLRAGKNLNPEHQGVCESAPTETNAFCKTVRLFPENLSISEYSMRLHVKERLRELIDSAYPGCHARNFVNDQEVDDIAARLLMFEFRLWSLGISVGWHDVEAEIGIDRLISDLRIRSMADGTLIPLHAFLGVEDGGADEEKTRAVQAARAGKVLPRPKVEDEVWESIDRWWEGAVNDIAKRWQMGYLVVILAGAHGTGKTWSLARIGDQIQSKYKGIRVCIAGPRPPSHLFPFGNLAISQPGPCAILIDDFFPDWSGLVSCIVDSPPFPLLMLGTADRPSNDEDVQKLKASLGRRVKLIEFPDYVDDTEAKILAQARGAEISETERIRTKATNIRRAVQILSGHATSKHLSAMLTLFLDTETIDLLGPILFCTSIRVAIPKILLERTVKRSLPLTLQPWVLGSRAVAGELLSIEDPIEADSLLTEAFGGARVGRIQEWSRRLIQHVESERVGERVFVRRLLWKLSSSNPVLCRYLLDSCRQHIDEVISRETLPTLIFSWLTILARDGREDLVALALTKVTAAPTTVAEIAIYVEAFGTAVTRQYLKGWLAQLPPWDSALIGRFVEVVMALPKEARRNTAMKLTSLLVELPVDLFVQALSLRNCFQEASILASDFGLAHDRKAFLYRVREMIGYNLDTGRAQKQKWFEVSRVLTERVISQGRFRLAIEIVRRMLIDGNMGFNAEEYYKICFDEEQALVHRPLINLGLKLLQESHLRSRISVPPVAGNLITFATSWANEEEHAMVADAIIEFIESLSVRTVSFDRVSAIVLPAFSIAHRGTQPLIERFLSAVLSWLPDESKLATVETTKLMLQVLGLVTTQPWMGEPSQNGARKALLEMFEFDDRIGEKTKAAPFEELRATLKLAHKEMQRIGMPDGWTGHSSLAKTYMAQVRGVRWEDNDRVRLTKRLISTWQYAVHSRQYLTEALLRLEDLDGAHRFAREMVKDDPSYPDSFGYLAVASAKAGDTNKARSYLAHTVHLKNKHGRGLHPHLTCWIHRELARVCKGRLRIVNLLCAELNSMRPLRAFDNVVDEASW